MQALRRDGMDGIVIATDLALLHDLVKAAVHLGDCVEWESSLAVGQMQSRWIWAVQCW